MSSKTKSELSTFVMLWAEEYTQKLRLLSLFNEELQKKWDLEIK